MERKPLYQFGEWFVKKTGELVAEAKLEGKVRMLNEQEVRIVLLTTFKILGAKAKISVAGMNRVLGRHKISR